MTRGEQMVENGQLDEGASRAILAEVCMTSDDVWHIRSAFPSALKCNCRGAIFAEVHSE